jgi:ribosomal protein S18 acetylase RimI-like enzyme
MQGTTTIEDFRPADLAALLPMWRASFEHGVGVVDPHPIEEQAAYFLREVLPLHRVRIARGADGTLLGFVACNAESVAQLYVRVGHHGHGLGSRLLALAKDGSAGSLWLYTFARNARARRFYEHHGFSATAFGFEPFWQLDDVRYEWRRGA